jgi:HPt (histidine-containing phosphotransfer) domain-containing protein
MKQALDKKGAKALKTAAHALKGTASNLGARTLAGLCAQLEQESKNPDLGDAHKLYGQIQTEFDQVRFVLEQERKT